MACRTSGACVIILTTHGAGAAASKERRQQMQAAADVRKALLASKTLKASVPTFVWASTAQKELAAALRACADGAEVSMVVWKLKRNRVALLKQPLTAASGLDFLQDMLAGSKTGPLPSPLCPSLIALHPISSLVLILAVRAVDDKTQSAPKLSHDTPASHYYACLAGNANFCPLTVPVEVLLAADTVPPSAAAAAPMLPPAFLDWAYPSNLGQETLDAPTPPPPSPPPPSPESLLEPPSEEALLV